MTASEILYVIESWQHPMLQLEFAVQEGFVFSVLHDTAL